MDANVSNYVLQTVQRFAHLEFTSLQLTELRKIAGLLGVSTASKRKEVLIDELSRTLGASILKCKTGFTSMIGGFPIINPDSEIGIKHPTFRKIIEKCNEFTASSFSFAIPHQAQLLAQRPLMNLFGYIDPMQILNSSLLNRFPQGNLMQPQVQTQLQQQAQPKPQVLPKKKLSTLNCVCGLPVFEDSKDPLVKCINGQCDRVLHANCVKMKPGSEEARIYECPDCTLKRCDPLHDVLDILRTPFRVDLNKQEFMIDQNCYKRIESDENIGIEIRCIRIEEKSHEQTWPHQGELFLNSKRELEFKPLQQNSSLKKRKDEKLFTRNIICGLNNLLIKYIPKHDFPRKQEGETYFAAIYLVRRISCEELIGRIKRNNIRKIEDCKALLKEHFREGDIEIDRLSYPLTCVLDMQLLKTPVKGAHCKHVNCFSLENFVNVWHKNSQRKWLCPICKTKSYDIIVDSYFQEIMKAAQENGVVEKELPEVTIDKNANYSFNLAGEKEYKSKKSKEEKMIPEQVLEVQAPKSEEAKLSTSENTAGQQPKKGREESNKNAAAFMIVLDSDEEEAPPNNNASRQPELQTTSQNIGQTLLEGYEGPGMDPQAGSKTNTKENLEEVKMHIEPDTTQNLRQQLDAVLNALKENTNQPAQQLNPISNSMQPESTTTNQGDMVLENPSQQQSNGGINNSEQPVTAILPQTSEKNSAQTATQHKEIMEIEISDDSNSCKDESVVKQPPTKQPSTMVPENLNSNYYPGLGNYVNPNLFTGSGGYGMGFNENLLQDFQKSLLLNNGMNQFQAPQLQQQQLQTQLQQQLLQQQQLQQQQQHLQQLQLQQQIQQQQQQLKAQQQQQHLAQHQMNQPQNPVMAQFQQLQQASSQQVPTTELTALQKEKKELCFAMGVNVGGLEGLISSTKEKIAEITKRADKEEDLLTFEAFSGNKPKKPKKSIKYAISTKQKFLKSFYKYLDDELKQSLGGKGADVPRKRKVTSKSEKEKERKNPDKIQIENEGPNQDNSGEQIKKPLAEGNTVPKPKKSKSGSNSQSNAAKKIENGGSVNQMMVETPANELLNPNNMGSVNNRETQVNLSKGQASDPICLD